MLFYILGLISFSAYTTALLSGGSGHYTQNGNCSSSVISSPTLPEAEILSLSAAPVTNYVGDNFSIDFCNVTISYTHPGWNDTIHVTIWLPLQNWNGRLQGSGGGRYATRPIDSILAAAVAANYSVVATDGGHRVNNTNAESWFHESRSSKSWSLNALNEVNLYLLQDFASVALNDASVVGKQVTHSFYGQPAHHSYWNGCGTGGRQGLMLAQRYPDAFDGIVAAAPAINWPSFTVGLFWPQFVMNQLSRFPPQCVMDTITTAAVDACDDLDGVVDGVIGAADLCQFDPASLVGQSVNCNGVPIEITEEDTTIVQKIWEGPRSVNGSFLWHGFEPGTNLSGVANTSCSASASDCTGVPSAMALDWINLFVEQNPSRDLTNLSHVDLDNIFYRSNQKYSSIIATDDPDLSAFKNAGGKMISWHGLIDAGIPPKGTRQYYRRVEALDTAREWACSY
ncbi:hypothetical protein EYZ11_005315 [Aspergillus tanneri]|uniref:Carboxylic ester hydrolase n=1 Tax=Aspergillus tanneri TaxID=1220188 RepID=A0A4S3JI75_9EURO|nr:hypothetical protein EYZ11_005315 [Aspergillus tanneri]